MANKLTRREFLKLSTIALGAAAFRTLSPTDLRLGQPLTQLGRVTIASAKVISRPNPQGQLLGTKARDELVEIRRAVVGEGWFPHNHVWFEIPEGYIYSSLVQPVKNDVQTPVTTLPDGGFYGEISVPYTDARAQADVSAAVVHRLYYSAVFKIKNVRTGADGAVWYQVDDDQAENFWAEGRHVRVISADEVTPLAPDVTDKIIVADVSTHWLSAYEGKTEVFRTRIASGATFFEPNGTARAALTPGGAHWIWGKRFSRHMAGGVAPNGFNLPGIGWVAYFAGNGAAIHSTYWHNDYGRPRSHGCLNCTPAAAKWLFRWSLPPVDYIPGNVESQGTNGTRVEIKGTPPPLVNDGG